MAELKTKQTTVSVTGFLSTVKDSQRRKDCQTVLRIMKDATGVQPRMWGPSIVGFGKYKYKYESGREGEWPVIGFSPRKGDLTLYIMSGFEKEDALMSRLGKHKTGKSCLYLKSLEDVDLAVLKKLIDRSVKAMARQRLE